MTPAIRAVIELRVHDLRNADTPAQRGELAALKQCLWYADADARSFVAEAITCERVAATMGDARTAAYWRARRDTVLMIDAMVGL